MRHSQVVALVLKGTLIVVLDDSAVIREAYYRKKTASAGYRITHKEVREICAVTEISSSGVSPVHDT